MPRPPKNKPTTKRLGRPPKSKTTQSTAPAPETPLDPAIRAQTKDLKEERGFPLKLHPDTREFFCQRDGKPPVHFFGRFLGESRGPADHEVDRAHFELYTTIYDKLVLAVTTNNNERRAADFQIYYNVFVAKNADVLVATMLDGPRLAIDERYRLFDLLEYAGFTVRESV